MNRSVFGGAVATAGVPRPASAGAAVPAPSSYLLIGKQVAFTVAQDFTPTPMRSILCTSARSAVLTTAPSSHAGSFFLL